jgi:hypothetical protein
MRYQKKMARMTMRTLGVDKVFIGGVGSMFCTAKNSGIGWQIKGAD